MKLDEQQVIEAAYLLSTTPSHHNAVTSYITLVVLLLYLLTIAVGAIILYRTIRKIRRRNKRTSITI